MAERTVVLEEPVIVDEQSEALRQAVERAERAEAELAKLKQGVAASHRERPAATAKRVGADHPGYGSTEPAPDPVGVEALRNDSMMAHLLDSLDAGKDIGHYGRLVFAMVARHFLPHEEVVAWLTRDRDFSEEQANLMMRQVEGRDYNPPRRERILEWQREQDFPILPYPDDPDCGNLYRNLKFPDSIYDHIGQYQEQKMESGQ